MGGLCCSGRRDKKTGKKGVRAWWRRLTLPGKLSAASSRVVIAMPVLLVLHPSCTSPAVHIRTSRGPWSPRTVQLISHCWLVSKYVEESLLLSTFQKTFGWSSSPTLRLPRNQINWLQELGDFHSSQTSVKRVADSLYCDPRGLFTEPELQLSVLIVRLAI